MMSCFFLDEFTKYTKFTKLPTRNSPTQKLVRQELQKIQFQIACHDMTIIRSYRYLLQRELQYITNYITLLVASFVQLVKKNIAQLL
jgi:hypothetical protein